MTSEMPQAPKDTEAPPPPRPGLLARWRKAREAKRHDKWMENFLAEFAKPDSKVHQTVLVQANAMARGMVMRHFDDRGIPRCRLCISTDQLVKRVLESKRGPNRRWVEKVIWLCQAHKDVQLPTPGQPAAAPAMGQPPAPHVGPRDPGRSEHRAA